MAASKARDRRRERGFALLIVLWAMVLLAILASQVTGAGRAESHLAAALRQSAELEEAANGAVYETIWHLLDGSGEQWPVAAGTHFLEEPGGVRVRVDIEDERGKLDINQVPEPLLEALFVALGFDSGTARNAAVGISDWHQQGGNGNEDGAVAQYRMEGRTWGPPGQEFERLDELKLVRGVTPAIYKAALPYLTLALEQGPWLQYTGPVVQSAISIAKRSANLSVDAPDTRGPTVLKLTVTAEGADRSRFIRRVLLRLDGSLSGPAWKYRFLAWESGPEPAL